MAENRFSGLGDALKKSKQTSKRSDVQPSSDATAKAKSKSADYSKLTCYITKALHKRLRMASAELEQEMSAIVEQALNEYLENK